MNINATNQLADGEIVFAEGEKTGCIYMVLKGKVEVYNRGCAISVGAGTVLGINNLSGDESTYSCRASGPAAIYAFAADGKNPLGTLLSSNKEYNGISVFNHAKLLVDLTRHYKELCDFAGKLFNDIRDYYAAYIEMLKTGGCKANLINEISKLGEYVPVTAPEAEKLNICLEYAKIPYDTIKAFFGGSPLLTRTRLFEMFIVESVMIDACAEVTDYILENLGVLCQNPEGNLYRSLIYLGIDLKKTGKDTAAITKIIDDCREKIAYIKGIITASPVANWTINDELLESMRNSYINGEDFRSEEENAGEALDSDVASVIVSLQDSLEQILLFGGYPEDKAEEFKELVEQYIALPDREGNDDSLRPLRKKLTDHFYALYGKVYMETHKKPAIPKVVELFLNYGFVSERLLDEERLAELVQLKLEPSQGPCEVYTIKEWLDAVYAGKKEPSRNDMGQDYPEVLRELKKQGKIDAEGEKALLVDGNMKVDYEIKNVFSHANKLVNGQISLFVPLLHSEVMLGNLAKAFNSAAKLNQTINELTAVDFSVFYREALYIDEANKIEREYEMKEVFPVFILYPTVGQNVMMWQEITGRKRDSEGRFFAPMFTFSPLKDVMIKTLGQFRWALCKTIQGTNWNNIQIHSLSADYSDYIQFFKKNHDLSDEKKEKVKLQIQRGRNNLREIFTLDYEAWMKSEANGAIKMNKVAREILATYCPFSAEMKAALVRQPIYEEAFARNTRERNKKVHELELRYRALENKGGVITPQLEKTLKYYKEM